ncbi:MAG: 2-oxoacid:acceptor oxidoreductase family protein, partial [Bacillota bacterium]
EMGYPSDIKEKVRAKNDQVIFLDASDIAQKAGSVRSLNLVLLGCLSYYLPMPKKDWIKAIKDIVKPHTLEINLTAFRLGREVLEIMNYEVIKRSII